MRHKLFCGLFAMAIVAVLAGPAQAQLTPYSQDFEGLVQSDGGALAGDGWLVFGNVFGPTGVPYLYGYGPFPAPNGGPGFSGIDLGQGGPGQGDQQLVIYNDYNNLDHAAGNLIEANVFQEQTVGAADVGRTWIFSFEHKRGNIQPPTTALAFIKTLDPNNGFALTNFFTADMTNIPNTWGGASLSITIDASLAPGGTGPLGQILQVGFASTTTNYTPSGIFYDNILFEDPDPDDDGIVNADDNCPNTANPGQADGDNDGVGDDCDNCPFNSNPDQADGNLNGVGDVCDPEPIPTVSEWGLMLMALLLLTVGTVVLLRNSAVLAGAGTASMSVGAPPRIWVPALFARMLALAVGVALLGLMVAASVGRMPSATDVVGSLLCAPVAAYLVHLWVARAKE